jgi:hypothetical protein
MMAITTTSSTSVKPQRFETDRIQVFLQLNEVGASPARRSMADITRNLPLAGATNRDSLDAILAEEC